MRWLIGAMAAIVSAAPAASAEPPKPVEVMVLGTYRLLPRRCRDALIVGLGPIAGDRCWYLQRWEQTLHKRERSLKLPHISSWRR